MPMICWTPQGALLMKNKLPVILFLSAIALIGAGAFRGEVLEVLNKGINLCLECVGIG